jgi:hypothetical protein
MNVGTKPKDHTQDQQKKSDKKIFKMLNRSILGWWVPQELEEVLELAQQEAPQKQPRCLPLHQN